MSRCELLVALMRRQVAHAEAATQHTVNVWASALKHAFATTSPVLSLPAAQKGLVELTPAQFDVATPMFALSVTAAWGGHATSPALPSLLTSTSHCRVCNPGDRSLYRFLFATTVLSRMQSSGGSAAWMSHIHWRALLNVAEASGRYDLPLPRDLGADSPSTMDAVVCGASLELHTPRFLFAAQFVMLLTSCSTAAADSNPVDEALIAHAALITSQVQTLRRTYAAEALRLWTCHTTLASLARHRQRAALDALGDVSAVSSFLVSRVAEFVAEGGGGAGRSSTGLKPSTWDAVATLCVASLPHHTKHAVKVGLRRALQSWCVGARASPEAVAFAGCRKVIALCAESIAVLPLQDHNHQHDDQRAQHNAFIGFGRPLLRAYRGFTRTPVSEIVQSLQGNESHHHLGRSAALHTAELASVRTWGALVHVLMGYKFHTSQTNDQRLTRLTSLVEGAAALPLDSTITGRDWADLHRAAVFAATSGASPLLSYHLLVKVLHALNNASRAECAFDWVAMSRGLQELLSVLLPVVPVRQWLPWLWRIEASPGCVLSDVCTPNSEWKGVIDVLAAAVMDELPLHEVVQLFEGVQGDASSDGDGGLLLCPLPLVSLMVLERCVALSTSAARFGRVVPRLTDADKWVQLSQKFHLSAAHGVNHAALVGRSDATPTFSCGGCVHREALLASMHACAMEAARVSAAATLSPQDQDMHESSHFDGDATIMRPCLPTSTPHEGPHIPPVALTARDVNTEVRGVWRRSIASAVIALRSCVLVPSSPHHLRHLLTRVLGAEGTATLPAPYQALAEFYGNPPAEPLTSNSMVHRGVVHLHQLWAGSVASMWDARVVGQHGVVDPSYRLAKLMLSENSTHGVAVIGGRSTLAVAPRPSIPPTSAAAPPNIAVAWYHLLQTSGLLVADCAGVDTDAFKQWAASTPTHGQQDGALLLRHLVRALSRDVQGAVEREVQDAITASLLGDVWLATLRGALVDGGHQDGDADDERQWLSTLVAELDVVGRAIDRAVQFERLLMTVSNAADDADDAYNGLMGLLEEHVNDLGAAVVPAPLALDPRHIPEDVHARYFMTLQHRGSWEIGVATVRRCQLIQDRWATSHGTRHQQHGRGIVACGTTRHSSSKTFLPSSVLGSLVVACLAANVELPLDVRASLLRC